MKKSAIYSMILGACLCATDAHSQDAQGGVPATSGSESVSGIFDGMVVGGTTRKTAGRNRASTMNQAGKRDSFAINPAANASNNDANKNRVQMRSEMIPAVDSGSAQQPIPVAPVSIPVPPADAQPAPAPAPDRISETANAISNITQQAVQGAGSASPQYYRQLINQAKKKSDADSEQVSPKSKYVVSEKDKF